MWRDVTVGKNDSIFFCENTLVVIRVLSNIVLDCPLKDEPELFSAITHPG